MPVKSGLGVIQGTMR